VNNTLIYSFVNERNGRGKQFATGIFVVSTKGRPQLFDLRPKLAAIAAIDRVSLNVLPDSLFSGFMICHCLYSDGHTNAQAKQKV